MSVISATQAQQVGPEPTTRVTVSDKDELDVWVWGEGEPVVFVHGAMVRDLLKPLADELVRRGGYQVIHYGRRGHGGRGLPGQATDITGQAADIVAILDALRIDRAHVTGHSFGAFVALELAVRSPERLRSAVLLEPFLAEALSEASQQIQAEFERAFATIAEQYSSGEAGRAVTAFADLTAGVEGVWERLEQRLPTGARALAAADLNTFFQVDGPAMGTWLAKGVPVQQITSPIVWIGGADSPSMFADTRTYLRRELPRTKTYEVDGVGHCFPGLKPAETAAALDAVLSP
jgi:pimeloyl-ACP methyl ester carboxylesterase